MKKLAIGLLAAVVTLSVGIGLAVYVRHRAQAKRCAESTYFTAGAFGENSTAERLGQYYAAQDEPKFSCLDEDVEVYRLFYLPAFDSPTTIRISRDGQQYQMTIKQLDAHWLPSAGGKGLIVSTTRPLAVNEWAEFKRRLVRTNFWSMPSADVRERGFDGVSFTLEGRESGRYHVVHRWTPEPNDSFANACQYLLKISNLTWRQSAK